MSITDRNYIQILEDLIMDKLLPAYILQCRGTNTDPKVNQILHFLLKAKSSRKKVPVLLGGLG